MARPFRELSDELCRKLNICHLSERVDDDTKHSWQFDGDDPRIVCLYCGQTRDAISGKVLVAGRSGATE